MPLFLGRSILVKTSPHAGSESPGGELGIPFLMKQDSPGKPDILEAAGREWFRVALN